LHEVQIVARTAKGFSVSANFAPAMKVSVSVSAVIRQPVSVGT
jgi:hypothetical protein